MIAVFTETLFGVESDGSIKVFKDLKDATEYITSRTDGIDRVLEHLLLDEHSNICVSNDKLNDIVLNDIVLDDILKVHDAKLIQDLQELKDRNYVPTTKLARAYLSQMTE